MTSSECPPAPDRCQVRTTRGRQRAVAGVDFSRARFETLRVTTGRIRRRAVGVVLAVLLVGVVAVWGPPAVGTVAAASAAPVSAGAIVSAQDTIGTDTTGRSSSDGA